MTLTTKIPIRTVYDVSNNPLGLSEFQNNEVVGVEYGGTAANSIPLARAIFSVDQSNIRNLFSITGGGSFYNNTTGQFTVDLFTANVTETTNLYFTTQRSRDAVSAVGSILYDNTTGVFSYTQGNTDTIVEGVNNLYFTTQRVKDSVSATGSILYNNTTGVFSFTQGNTNTVAEGSSNLYFTTQRARESVSLAGNALYYSSNGVFDLRALSTINYVDSKISNLVDSAPEALNTLNELSRALSNDENFSNTIVTLIGTKADSVSLTTANVAELNNLYFTNTRAVSSLIGTEISTGNITVEGSIFSTGNINSQGPITSPFFYSESDIQLKENVQPIQDALGKVLLLNGVSFTWKQNQQKAIGLIAQEVEKILPEVISSNPSGLKTVSYDSIIALLVEAIKLQQQQINFLKSKL